MIAPRLVAPPTIASGPSATISVLRQDRYSGDDAIVVTTIVGDAAGSHHAAFLAIKKAGIRPAFARAGTMKITFDPSEIDAAAAEAIVVTALRDGGVKIHRRSR